MNTLCSLGMDAILFNYHKDVVPVGIKSIDKLIKIKDFL
jgi:hypothetical protein